MSRTVRITVPAEETTALLQRIEPVQGVTAIIVHPGAVRRPQADLLVLHATNQAAHRIARIALELGLADRGCISMGEPVALVSADHRREIRADTDEASWEEMDTLLRRDSSLSHNFLGLMLLSGATAGIGLFLDQLYIVLAAMLITPAFTPIVRIVMGAVSGLADTARDGAKSMLVGYLALAIGGALGMALAAWADPVLGVEGIAEREWVAYWSTVSRTGVVAAVVAGFAGAIVVNAHKTVFATGVMVALALVPAAAIVGMGISVGDFGLALGGLGRWATDSACVLATGGAFFGVKRALIGRRAHP